MIIYTSNLDELSWFFIFVFIVYFQFEMMFHLFRQERFYKVEEE